ncbi:unnamed protein product [Menidia menidia]|uniref:(Atlantic silverside) hypothetical protein n=1 Tax=Menidia menidia TaxID=238744 RepID=A0A8S4B1C0_9TELE|nr:unnamed protein product [Menidia menidia]
MAESGKSVAGGGGEGEGGLCPGVAPSHGSKRHLPRGIVIHLTGTEGQWDSLDESELIFSLDHDEDCPSVTVSKERPLSSEDDGGPKSQTFHVPLSPSSPGSLGNCSPGAPGFLSPGPPSPTHRPFASLVKSLSTELEPKEGCGLRPRPFLSLVKSISTEISRSEPEVSQSRSDSRLNLHLWKQLTQARGRSNGDSRTAPPSPSSLSPTEDGPRGGFFKMELEDTKRKLTEAMQEPLSSVLGMMKREEGAGGGSPKHREGGAEAVPPEPPAGKARRADAEGPPAFDWPPAGRRRGPRCPLHGRKRRPQDQRPEACPDGDPRAQAPPPSPHPLPRMGLLCVAALSYGYFILPLGPYCSGVALGLALGFLLGLLLIRTASSRPPAPPAVGGATPAPAGEGAPTAGLWSREPDTLQGWMNEICDYDPETCHPALTHSVFASLEGSRLRLDYPRSNVRRRAAYDERIPEAAFTKSRCLQLSKSKIFLLPPMLARKRVWNPKYPICVQLASGLKPEEEERGGSVENMEERPEAEPAASPDLKQTQDPSATLYLFGRTGREKEEWFRHLQLASIDKERERDEGGQRAGRCLPQSGDPAHPAQAPVSRGPSRVGSSDEDGPSTPPAPPASSRGRPALSYSRYMAALLAAGEPSPLSSPLSSPSGSSTEASPTITGTCTCDLVEYAGQSLSTAWANALIGRIFWDFLREKLWADAVSHKIQKKLSKIRLPYFMNELTLTELDMGCSMPQITATSRPEVNHRGLWLQLQLAYTGNLQMTLQTKFNLSKLGKEGGQDTPHCWTESGGPRSRPVLSVLADSDEESSSAGSSDEEELLISEPLGSAGEKGSAPPAEGTGGGKTGRKILKFVDKIAKSKYFQKAAENEFIKKKFEEMSNTPLLLSVEVQELSGSLVVNIPPPPTDRIWYSFCVPPKLDLHVRPKLGEREVTFCHVTEWIERKLKDEFQKVFVLPNMDDIYLPLMFSGVDRPQAYESQRSQSSSTESIEEILCEVTRAGHD